MAVDESPGWGIAGTGAVRSGAPAASGDTPYIPKPKPLNRLGQVLQGVAEVPSQGAEGIIQGLNQFGTAVDTVFSGVADPSTGEFAAQYGPTIQEQRQKALESEAARAAYLPNTTPQTSAGAVARGVGVGIGESAIPLAALGPLGVTSKVGQAAGTAARVAGAGARGQAMASGIGASVAGATQFGATQGTVEATRTGDAGKIAEGALAFPNSVAKIARGEGGVDDYVNVLLAIGSGAYAAWKARPTGSQVSRPVEAPKARANTGISPEAQAFVDSIPESQLAAVEARLARGGEGAQAMRQAIKARMAGQPQPKAAAPETAPTPAETPATNQPPVVANKPPTQVSPSPPLAAPSPDAASFLPPAAPSAPVGGAVSPDAAVESAGVASPQPTPAAINE
ncbi:MAG TPA: hypothetical protein VFH51_06950, partial [Myxococcota bacterium]|nr:hypothetical protein [Myxococcota bacterium]